MDQCNEKNIFNRFHALRRLISACQFLPLLTNFVQDFSEIYFNSFNYFCSCIGANYVANADLSILVHFFILISVSYQFKKIDKEHCLGESQITFTISSDFSRYEIVCRSVCCAILKTGVGKRYRMLTVVMFSVTIITKSLTIKNQHDTVAGKGRRRGVGR